MNLLSNLTLVLTAFHLGNPAMAAMLRGGNTSRELQDQTRSKTLQAGDTLVLQRPSNNGQVKKDLLDNESPHLAVNYIIALEGTFPQYSGGTQTSGPMTGEIRLFGGNFAPAGWAFCEGQMVPIDSNAALFSMLGTTYGGDGRNAFGLPDLRGRAPVHHDSEHRLGRLGGTKSHFLTNDNLPTNSKYVVESVVSS